MSGTVLLPGRPTPPDPSWVATLSIRLFTPGTQTPLRSETKITDNSGHFVVEGITPGTYDIVVKGSNTLAKRLNGVVLVAGQNTLTVGDLRGGDASGDNSVGLTDLSILASSYGTCGGDLRADFNGDTCVNLKDLSILASNYGQTGS
jgi:hypothetical protein